MKFPLAFVLSIFLLTSSHVATADWFLSSETKALIAKADAGDADAQFRVGNAYDSGNGAPHSQENALQYYLMAAEQGLAEAQNSVGSLLQADKRYSEALVWYERASAQGNASALNNLAYLHDLGLGVQQNRQKGFELYSRAAELGLADAMWNIANMYGAGQLGKEDLVMACVWTYRAGKFATPKERRLISLALKTLPQVESRLSADQMSSCHQQGDEWEPKAASTHPSTQPDRTR